MKNTPTPRLFLKLRTDRIHAFFPLLQHGFMVKIRVGCSIKTVLCEQFGLSTEYLEDRIKTILLDGKPVDSVDSAIVGEGAHLALSAAMPGLAGAVLRRESPLGSLRRQITHTQTGETVSRRKGTIVLKLFNLVLAELGPTFLREGILLRGDDLRRFFMNLLGEFWAGCREARLDGEEVTLDHLLGFQWLQNHDTVMLHIDSDVR